MQPLWISFKPPRKPISLTINQLLCDRKTFLKIPFKTYLSIPRHWRFKFSVHEIVLLVFYYTSITYYTILFRLWRGRLTVKDGCLDIKIWLFLSVFVIGFINDRCNKLSDFPPSFHFNRCLHFSSSVDTVIKRNLSLFFGLKFFSMPLKL